MKELKNYAGTLLQIIECRSNLSKSIFIPQAAFAWVKKALSNALDHRFIELPRWKHKVSLPKFQIRILKNCKGRNLWISKTLSKNQITSICIPEEHRCSGWALFERSLARQIHTHKL